MKYCCRKNSSCLGELSASREQVKALENGLREVREQLGYLQIQATLLKSA